MQWKVVDGEVKQQNQGDDFVKSAAEIAEEWLGFAAHLKNENEKNGNEMMVEIEEDEEYAGKKNLVFQTRFLFRNVTIL